MRPAEPWWVNAISGLLGLAVLIFAKRIRAWIVWSVSTRVYLGLLQLTGLLWALKAIQLLVRNFRYGH